MTKTTAPKGTVAAEQIKEWKEKHSDVFAYEADSRIGYLKRPSRQTVSAATVISTSNGTTDPFKFAEVLIENSWLGGDDTLRTEDKYFIGLSQKISEIVEITVGELKKL